MMTIEDFKLQLPPRHAILGFDYGEKRLGLAVSDLLLMTANPLPILNRRSFEVDLAQIKKTEVFEMAKKANLEAATREESQDFIGEEYFDLLFSDKPSVPGDIIDLDGHILGRHKGIEHYTIGQRRGLGVAMSYPVYVQAIDAKNNVVVLAPNDALNSSALIADDFV